MLFADFKYEFNDINKEYKARFTRRISAVSNAIETKENEMIWFIIFCSNCIRHGTNATYEQGLIHSKFE